MFILWIQVCLFLTNSVGASSADTRDRVPRADETSEGRGARARFQQGAPDRCRQADASGS